MLFNSLAVALMLFIVWWFWLAKTKAAKIATDHITIYVKDGVYSPSHLEVPASRHIVLSFIRQDPTPCSEYLVIERLNIHEQLPLNKKHSIKLNDVPVGRYKFSCQMGMYQGELIIK